VSPNVSIKQTDGQLAYHSSPLLDGKEPENTSLIDSFHKTWDLYVNAHRRMDQLKSDSFHRHAKSVKGDSAEFQEVSPAIDFPASSEVTAIMGR
jgi:hypothetical protein